MLVIKLELEHIKHQIISHLSDRQSQIEGEVEKAIDGMIDSFEAEIFIRNKVQEVTKQVLEESINFYFKFGEGHRAIRDAVEESLGPMLPGAAATNN